MKVLCPHCAQEHDVPDYHQVRAGLGRWEGVSEADKREHLRKASMARWGKVKNETNARRKV